MYLYYKVKMHQRDESPCSLALALHNTDVLITSHGFQVHTSTTLHYNYLNPPLYIVVYAITLLTVTICNI